MKTIPLYSRLKALGVSQAGTWDKWYCAIQTKESISLHHLDQGIEISSSYQKGNCLSNSSSVYPLG